VGLKVVALVMAAVEEEEEEEGLSASRTPVGLIT
jgi:hypothetical protein